MAHIWALAFASGARRAREAQEQREEELRKYQQQKEEEEKQRQVLVNKFSQKYHPNNTEPLSPEIVHYKKVQKPAEYVWHEGKLYTTDQLTDLFSSLNQFHNNNNDEDDDEDENGLGYYSNNNNYNGNSKVVFVNGIPFYLDEEGQLQAMEEYNPEYFDCTEEEYYQYIQEQQMIHQQQMQEYDEEDEEEEDDDDGNYDDYDEDDDDQDDQDDNNNNHRHNNNVQRNYRNYQQQIRASNQQQQQQQQIQQSQQYQQEETFIDDQQSTLHTLDQSNKQSLQNQSSIELVGSQINIDNNFESKQTDYQQTIEEENKAQKPQKSVIKSSYKKN